MRNRALRRNPVPGRPNERIPIGGGGGGGFNPTRLPNPIYVLVAGDATVQAGPTGSTGAITFSAGTCTLTLPLNTIGRGYSGSTITITGTGVNDGAFTIRTTTTTTVTWQNPSGANYDFASGGSWSVRGLATDLIDRANGHLFTTVGSPIVTSPDTTTPAANTSDVPGRLTFSSSYDTQFSKFLFNQNPAVAGTLNGTVPYTSITCCNILVATSGGAVDSAISIMMRASAINQAIGSLDWLRNSITAIGVRVNTTRDDAVGLTSFTSPNAPPFVPLGQRLTLAFRRDPTADAYTGFLNGVPTWSAGPGTVRSMAGLQTTFVMSPGLGLAAFSVNNLQYFSARLSQWGGQAAYAALLSDAEILELHNWYMANT